MSNFGDSSTGPRALSGLSFEIALITTLTSNCKSVHFGSESSVIMTLGTEVHEGLSLVETDAK